MRHLSPGLHWAPPSARLRERLFCALALSLSCLATVVAITFHVCWLWFEGSQYISGFTVGSLSPGLLLWSQAHFSATGNVCKSLQ
jgi:hypothetical protein